MDKVDIKESKRNLGRAIEMLRISKGIAQKELASTVGINSAYLSRIEKGERMPSHDVLHALACCLETTASNILLEAEFSGDRGNLKGIYLIAKAIECLDIDKLEETIDYLKRRDTTTTCS